MQNSAHFSETPYFSQELQLSAKKFPWKPKINRTWAASYGFEPPEGAVRFFRIPEVKSSFCGLKNKKVYFLTRRNIFRCPKSTGMPECAKPYVLLCLGRPPGGEIRKSCISAQKLHISHFYALFAKSCKIHEPNHDKWQEVSSRKNRLRSFR